MISFDVRGPARIRFGTGSFTDFIDGIGRRNLTHIALVIGGSWFRKSKYYTFLETVIKDRSRLSVFSLAGEPSVDFIDSVATELRAAPPDLLIGLGGGSALDGAKAVAAMVPVEGGIKDYLEGVGACSPSGETLPVAAIPTTSGTGAEATKNAVISRVGKRGFKKSLRHGNYIPDEVIVDPELTLSCPRRVTVSAGMDAITQLLEAYVSTRASNYTDAIAYAGLKAAGHGFPAAVRNGMNLNARSEMALAALYSGIALTNAGLGIVHGLASPIGAAFPAPHGAICGTLVAESTKMIIGKLREEVDVEAGVFLGRYGAAGAALAGNDLGSIEDNCDSLVDLLAGWTREYDLPSLSAFGITGGDLPGFAAKAGRKNSPAVLSTGEIEELMRARL